MQLGTVFSQTVFELQKTMRKSLNLNFEYKVVKLFSLTILVTRKPDYI